MGETQERERVLSHFSRRYLDCNPNLMPSEGKNLEKPQKNTLCDSFLNLFFSFFFLHIVTYCIVDSTVLQKTTI